MSGVCIYKTDYKNGPKNQIKFVKSLATFSDLLLNHLVNTVPDKHHRQIMPSWNIRGVLSALVSYN